MASISALSPHSFLPPKGTQTRGWTLLALWLIPLAFGVLALWLGQDANWDLRNYHIYNAYAWLHGRQDIDFMPSQLQFFFNPLLDVLFYLIATHVSVTAAFFVTGMVQGLNAVLVFFLCHAVLDIRNASKKAAACLGLALLGQMGTTGLSEIGMLFYDNIISLGALASLVLVLRYRSVLETAPWRAAAVAAIICGFPVGFATGLKLTCAIFALSGCAAFFFMGHNSDWRWRTAFFYGLGVATGLLVTYGCWGWFLQTHFGSPFFPFFNTIFNSPLLPHVRVFDSWFFPTTALQWLFYPFFFAVKPMLVADLPFRDFHVPVLYALLLAGLVLWGWKKIRRQSLDLPFERQYIFAVFILSYIVWLLQFSIYRYLVPLEMTAPLLIVMTIGVFPLPKKSSHALIAVLLLLTTVTVQGADWGRLEKPNHELVRISTPGKLPAEGMVLMAGLEGYAHLVTAMPGGLVFTRIQGRFPENPPRPFADFIDHKIRAYDGPLWMLMPARDIDSDASKIAQQNYHLKVMRQNCLKIRDEIYQPADYLLCRVRKL